MGAWSSNGIIRKHWKKQILTADILTQKIRRNMNPGILRTEGLSIRGMWDMNMTEGVLKN